MPKYFDIHSHTQFPAYDGDREEVIKRALDAGVWMANVGTGKKTSEEAVNLARKYNEGVYAIIGLHPIHTEKSHDDENESNENEDIAETEFDYEFYKKLAEDPKVVAIGECGLDFFHLDEKTKEKQIEIFKKQIDLSLDVDKPLMFHIRDAYKDALCILKDYFLSDRARKPRGDVHFFAGDMETAKSFLELGFNLSFTGVITFPKSNKPEMIDYAEIIKKTPIEMIMAETDAPYVAPMPYRGKRNEPLYVKEVVSRISEIKGIPEEEASKIILENSLRFFGL